MKEYRLNIAHTVPTDWGRIERAHVDSYVWGGGERAYATYGQLVYAKTEMRGNFYKCDENAGAPFGSWAPVTAPAPDFHRPECFGRILLTE